MTKPCVTHKIQSGNYETVCGKSPNRVWFTNDWKIITCLLCLKTRLRYGKHVRYRDIRASISHGKVEKSLDREFE